MSAASLHTAILKDTISQVCASLHTAILKDTISQVCASKHRVSAQVNGPRWMGFIHLNQALLPTSATYEPGKNSL